MSLRSPKFIEVLRPRLPEEVDAEARSQYEIAGPLHVNARTEVRKYGVPPRYIYDEAKELGGCKRSQNVVEFGSGGGSFLADLAENDPDGTYTGVEPWDLMSIVAESQIRKKGLLNAHIREADAKNLDFIDDASVDKVYALFMLYHDGKPWKVAKEARRILKEDGTFIAGTREVGDLKKLWWLVNLAPDFFQKEYPKSPDNPNRFNGIKQLQSFYSQCGFKKTRRILDTFFVRDEPDGVSYDSKEFIQSGITNLRIPKDQLGLYELAIRGLLELMDPTLRGVEIEAFLEAKVRPILQKEIDESPDGCIEDQAIQYLFRYKKSPSKVHDISGAIGMFLSNTVHLGDKWLINNTSRIKNVARAVGRLSAKSDSRDL